MHNLLKPSVHQNDRQWDDKRYIASQSIFLKPVVKSPRFSKIRVSTFSGSNIIDFLNKKLSLTLGSLLQNLFHALLNEKLIFRFKF